MTDLISKIGDLELLKNLFIFKHEGNCLKFIKKNRSIIQTALKGLNPINE